MQNWLFFVEYYVDIQRCLPLSRGVDRRGIVRAVQVRRQTRVQKSSDDGDGAGDVFKASINDMKTPKRSG